MPCFEKQLSAVVRRCVELNLPIDEAAGEIFKSVKRVQSTRVEGSVIHLKLTDGSVGGVVYGKRTPAIEQLVVASQLEALPGVQEFVTLQMRVLGLHGILASLDDSEDEDQDEDQDEAWEELSSKIYRELRVFISQAYTQAIQHACDDDTEHEVFGHKIVVVHKLKFYAHLSALITTKALEYLSLLERSSCQHKILLPKEAYLALGH